MEIRKTRPEELQQLMKLYENARGFMARSGNPTQWGNTYPAQSLIESDIASGCSYVCVEEGEIIATFFFREGEDSAYRRIIGGGWLNDRPYGVVHRITSSGKRKGAASFCLDWAFEQCGNLKIDTHRDNQIMRRLLEKKGFSQCGTIFTEDGSERIAFQKTE